MSEFSQIKFVFTVLYLQDFGLMYSKLAYNYKCVIGMGPVVGNMISVFIFLKRFCLRLEIFIYLKENSGYMTVLSS